MKKKTRFSRLGEEFRRKLDTYIAVHYVGEVSPMLLGVAQIPASKPQAFCGKSQADNGTQDSFLKTKLHAFQGKKASAEAFDRLVMVRDFAENYESRLAERMKHLEDTFSEYLLYLIKSKNMENADVWKQGLVDKKVFSKIKNNPDYHPQKLTALCLCMGARLNLDETKDLLARAGYALSPSSKTDVIFSFFIENGIYDMIELDIQLEEHGLPCIIA